MVTWRVSHSFCYQPTTVTHTHYQSLPPPSDPRNELSRFFRLSTFSGHGHNRSTTTIEQERSGMGVLHPSGMFLFEITIILFTNKFSIIYRLLGCFSNTTTTSTLENEHTHSFSMATAPCQHLQAPPSHPPSKTSVVARFWGRSLFANISTPSALKTSHVCSFMRAVAPCHPPLKKCSFLRAALSTPTLHPQKHTTASLENECAHFRGWMPFASTTTSTLEDWHVRSFPRAVALCCHHHPPFKMSAYAHFRGWLLSCHHSCRSYTF